MMAIVHFVTINNFTLIPVTRFIIDTFSLKNSVTVTEVFTQGQYDFQHVVQHTNLSNNKGSVSISQQSFHSKFFKYVRLLRFLLKQKNENSVIYTPDYQVVFILMVLRKLGFSGGSKVVYHQFEMVDEFELSGFSRRMWQYVVKQAKQNLELAVFPEQNRLEYFTRLAQYPNQNTCLVINSTKIPTESDDKLQLQFPTGSVIIGHIGSIGMDHYLDSFVEILKHFKSKKSHYFVVVGNYSDEIKTKLIQAGNPNLRIFGLVPHKELWKYYEMIDYGLILYKGVSMNFEFCAPNKLYEYISYGIKVIAQPLKGMMGVNGQGEVLELLDFNSYDFLSQFEKVVNQPNDKKKEIQMYFSENLSIDNYLPVLMDGVENILNEK